MPRFRVGSLTVHALHAGKQHLDGGAMFGVVPKPLWERRIAADARNRIPLAMRCLLIEHPTGLVLVDTGAGNKESDKFRDIYGLDDPTADGRTALEAAIIACGHSPDDVGIVIDTHLHFDHAGGNTYIAPDDPSRRVQLTFPRATYVIHRGEYEWATHPNERTQASYLPHNFVPVLESGRVRLVDGENIDVVPGIRMMVTPGHTPWHTSVLITDQGESLFYPADAMPTAHHMPLAWIMGYDVEPMRSLETKRAMLARGIAESWQVVFEHDAHTAGGRLKQGERGAELAERVEAGSQELGAGSW